jgi:hypothetical protein
MDPGAVIALVVGGLGLIALPVGGVIRYLLGQITRLETRVETTLKIADAKQETVDELRRQVDKLEITAVIQDRLFGRLPGSCGHTHVRGEHERRRHDADSSRLEWRYAEAEPEAVRRKTISGSR